MAKVGIVMGSDSDMPVMAKAADILSSLSAKGVKSAGKAYEDAASRIIEAANNSGQFMSGMRAVYKMMPSEWHVAKEFDKIKDGCYFINKDDLNKKILGDKNGE